MKSLHRISLLLASTTIALSAHAADMTRYAPKVEYSANQTMETADTTMSGKVYATPLKERREMNVSGETMTMIMRRDKNIAWTLIPSEKMYMEVTTAAIKQQSENLDNYKIETTSMGKEKINGVDCEKSKVIMTKISDGSKMGGFWWVTKDNIVMKMDMLSNEKNEKMRFKLELSDLKVGKLNPALFEIPAGYSKMTMPSMGDIQDMLRQSGTDDAGASEGNPKAKGGFNLNDAMQMIR
jgi:hypothetical protein